MASKKEISMKFFSKVIKDDAVVIGRWKCECGKELTQHNGSGYTNLHQHIVSCHSQDLISRTVLNQSTLNNFVNKKHSNVQGGANKFGHFLSESK